ncbi:MAG: DUF1987 domain-containing protein [Bacteroidia bacterium]
MEANITESTLKTPFIKFDPTAGKLEIKGRSISENSLEFFSNLIDNLNKYAVSPTAPTQVDIQLEYINTASSRCILEIFRCLENIHKKNGNVNINWHYEEDDENMCEVGEGYKAIINVPFNITCLGLN